MVWVSVFFSSVISMGVAYLFWFRGVRVLGPTRTSVYANLQPVIAIAFAWAALHEVPTAWQGLGAAMIVAGILMTRTQRVLDTA
jgi:drug/metabolite transporter (DMT)-like permease